MLRAEVTQAHVLPRTISDVLSEASTAGCSRGPTTTYAWTLHRQTILVWRVKDGIQAPMRRLLLDQLPRGRIFVKVIPHSNSAAVTVIACTSGGHLYVWLDANFPAPPFSQQLFVSADDSSNGNAGDAVICALSAATAGSGSSLGFMAVIGTADGSLHLYHGSQNGIFPKQFHKPAPAAGPTPGMLGAFGSVVKALYSEAFDPLHNVQRQTASAMGALQLHLQPVDGSRWKLFVLTPEALDCWLLGAVGGRHNGEQLLWSYNLHGVLSVAYKARELSILAFAVSSGSISSGTAAAGPTHQQSQVYVWTTHLGATSRSHQHALSCLTLQEGSTVPEFIPALSSQTSSHVLSLESTADSTYRSWQVVAHNALSSCLLLSPSGSVLEWMSEQGPLGFLGSSPEHLAISCCGPVSNGVSNWLLLNASYGALEFKPSAAVPQGVPEAAGDTMTPEQEGAALEMLNKTVYLMLKEYLAGCPYRDLAEGLADRLARLSVFKGSQGRQLLVAASSSLVDQLAKSGTGVVSAASLRGQLQDKQIRHDLMLAAFQSGQVLQQVSPQQCRAVLEHAEMLAAVMAVLDWQRDMEVAAAELASGVTRTQVAAAAAAIQAAGILSGEGNAGYDAAASPGQHWEMFFSRPVVSMPALFEAIVMEASKVRAATGSEDTAGWASHATQQLLGLSGLLQAAAAGAQAKAAELAAAMPDELYKHGSCEPSWLSAEAPRAAWRQLAQGCVQLLSCLLQPSERLQLVHQAHLPSFEALLNTLRDTIRHSTTPVAPGVREEYAEAASEHGPALLATAEEEISAMGNAGILQVASEAIAAGEILQEGPAAESVVQLNRALVFQVERVAQQHQCHELLYNTCDLLLAYGLLDEGRLLVHMKQEVQESGGQLSAGSFTYYVMQRWRANGELVRLLHLGQQGFQQQLQQFLSSHPALLWMSQVQSGQISQAAGTLATAADQEQGSMAKRRRLLGLCRLAARAASAADPATTRTQAAASAGLRQLALQEQLQLPVTTPLTPAQLASAALQKAGAAAAGAGNGSGGAHAAIAAVEILALVADQQQSEQYRQLWDRSWLSVLQHSHVEQLCSIHAAAKEAKGQPEDFKLALQATPLYQALLKAAAALADVSKVQASLSPNDVLDSVANTLIAKVQQKQPADGAVECLRDLLTEASRAADPILASA